MPTCLERPEVDYSLWELRAPPALVVFFKPGTKRAVIEEVASELWATGTYRNVLIDTKTFRP